MSLHEIKRIGVAPDSICRIWVEPIPNNDQEYSNYRAWGNMLDGASNIIWQNIDISDATVDSPVDVVLSDSNVFSILVDAVFSSSIGAGLKVTNEIYSDDGSGNMVSHGKPESRTLIPAADNALRWVSIYIIMA